MSDLTATTAVEAAAPDPGPAREVAPAPDVAWAVAVVDALRALLVPDAEVEATLARLHATLQEGAPAGLTAALEALLA
ncbi:MAG: hypothetical protein KIT58_04845, partial [Planctomycetota bacterium]|nr:hypothetical protein [Planctomycetota bacterium]